MDVRAQIVVGNFTAEAAVLECGPDALADAVRQAVAGALSLLGEELIRSAVLGVEDSDAEPPA